MKSKDIRVDEYIAAAAPFAQPILRHFRSIMHKAIPTVTETIKWRFPVFEYHGSILCTMAAFNAHCSIGFWKASLMRDAEKILETGEKSSMGQFGKLMSVTDLPSDKILTSYLKEAAMLNEEKIKKPAVARKAIAPRDLSIPAILAAALKKNPAAAKTFADFAPSHRKEYIEWIREAKTAETRQRRVDQTIEWVSAGKSRNWKYQR